MTKPDEFTERLLSKRDVQESLACRTRGWLAVRNDGADTPSEGERYRMMEGQEVHRRAQALHPQGIFAGDERATKRLLNAAEHSVIFEAAFSANGFIARADWIRRLEQGWYVGEVKSSLHDDEPPKDELIDDMAYTVCVLRRAGIRVLGAELVRLSRDWRLGMPDRELFVISDQTELVFARADELHAELDAIRQGILGEERPHPEWKWACRNCPLFASSCVGQGVPDPVFALPRLREARFLELTAAGITAINEIQEGIRLSDQQRLVAQAICEDRPIIDNEVIRSGLAQVQSPTGHLDFETAKTAIPLWPDVMCHEQIATQYSIHVTDAPGIVVEHHEYLADHRRDCRRELAERLIDDLRGCATVTSYSPFEKRIIRELTGRFPDLEADLTDIIGRLVDLEPILRRGYIHPRFGGRSSIKVVTPVIAPDLSYQGLEISDGDAAMTVFARMMQGLILEEEIEQVRQDLLAYCEVDTLAMVRLHEFLAEQT